MIDSAAWTGRTWEWVYQWWYYCGGMGVTIVRFDRDATECERRPVYGFQLGRHFESDAHGVTLFWNMTESRLLRRNRRPCRYP